MNRLRHRDDSLRNPFDSPLYVMTKLFHASRAAEPSLVGGQRSRRPLIIHKFLARGPRLFVGELLRSEGWRAHDRNRHGCDRSQSKKAKDTALVCHDHLPVSLWGQALANEKYATPERDLLIQIKFTGSSACARRDSLSRSSSVH